MVNKQAACVLVMDGPRLLGFRRYDSNKISLPGGKADNGENIYATAIREGFEETGFNLELDSNTQPYVAYDLVGGFNVYTYKAKIVGGQLTSSCPEGIPLWTSLSELPK